MNRKPKPEGPILINIEHMPAETRKAAEMLHYSFGRGKVVMALVRGGVGKAKAAKAGRRTAMDAFRDAVAAHGLVDGQFVAHYGHPGLIRYGNEELLDHYGFGGIVENPKKREYVYRGVLKPLVKRAYFLRLVPIGK